MFRAIPFSNVTLGGDLKIIRNAGVGVLNNSKCGKRGWHKVVLSVILNLKCAGRGGGVNKIEL